MPPPPRAEQRLTLSIASASIVTVAPFAFLCVALYRASYAGLGRDQGIFQGTAWAIAHGARLYRDLREINGPLVHELHLVASRFGGLEPHVLRSFDLIVSAIVFAFFGSSLPGATQPQAEARPLRERLAWAVAAASVLLAQYVAFYDYWRLTQRESFFDWFVIGGFACVLSARTSVNARSVSILLVCAGVASATPWFGKPQCALYSVLHVVCLVAGAPALALPRAKRLRAFALGLALGCALQLAFLLRYADVPEFVRIYFGENPRYYRYIWPRFLDDIVQLQHHVQFYPLALVLPLICAALVMLREFGFHMLGLAAFPVLAIMLDLFQRKAFTYHLHPVTAGSATLVLALLVRVADMAGTVEPGPLRARAALWPLSAAAGVGYYLAQALIGSPYLDPGWPDSSTAQARAAPEYLQHFDTDTFAGSGLVEAGAWLKTHTRPSDQIQLYGMDPYLLALAERQSATPYIYSIDLNPDAVLAGLRADNAPAAALENARALAGRNVRDLRARVVRAEPAAFVFFDRAPFMHPASGYAEFVAHVPELAIVLFTHYRAQPAFGLIHVYLRADLVPGPSAHVQSRGTGMPPVSSK